jgi:hypothetical protein
MTPRDLMIGLFVGTVLMVASIRDLFSKTAYRNSRKDANSTN